MLAFLLAVFVCLVIAGSLIAFLAAMGWTMPLCSAKVATARAWKAHRRELRDGVERMRVEVRS